MRNEFFGDRKDIWKWSVALDAADAQSAHILYVSMLTVGPGNDFGNAGPNVRNDVVKFFERERQGFPDPPARGIHRLQSWLGDRLHIFNHVYARRSRSQYFSEVCLRLRDRPAGTKYVVLVDPDNGLENSKPDKKHLCTAELEKLCLALNPGDVLIVYQHLDRTGSLDGHLGLLEGVLQKTGVRGTVSSVPYPSVVFFKIAIAS